MTSAPGRVLTVTNSKVQAFAFPPLTARRHVAEPDEVDIVAGQTPVFSWPRAGWLRAPETPTQHFRVGVSECSKGVVGAPHRGFRAVNVPCLDGVCSQPLAGRSGANQIFRRRNGTSLRGTVPSGSRQSFILVAESDPGIQ